MKKRILVMLLLAGLICLSGCNKNKEGVNSDVGNDVSVDSTESNGSGEITEPKGEITESENDLSKPEMESQVSITQYNVLEKSNVYRYVRAFNTMESGVIYGIITQSIGKTKTTTEYYCYKDGAKILSVIKSNDLIGWAEIFDGKNYYALNMQEKVYEKLNNFTLNTYNELLDLFECADGFEIKGAREAIHLSNSAYGIDTFLDCTLETNGVHINIVDNNGKSKNKEITISVRSLTDEDKKLFDISDYEEQEEESFVVSENSVIKPEELSIPANLD